MKPNVKGRLEDEIEEIFGNELEKRVLSDDQGRVYHTFEDVFEMIDSSSADTLTLHIRSFKLEEFLEEFFEDLDIKEYSYEEVEAFDSPGYRVDVVSIAWIDNDNELGHYLMSFDNC